MLSWNVNIVVIEFGFLPCSYNNPMQRTSRNEDPKPRKRRRERVEIPKEKSSNGIAGKKDKFSAAFGMSRAGGVYIPPAKLKAMQLKHSNDPKTAEYQRRQWEALRKTINGMVCVLVYCLLYCEKIFWGVLHKVQGFAWLEKVFFEYFLVIKTTEYCKVHNKWRSYDT